MEEYLENKKAGDLTPVGEILAVSTLFGEEPAGIHTGDLQPRPSGIRRLRHGTGTYFSDMNVLKIITTCYQKRIPMIVTTSLPPEVLNKESNATRKLALSRLKERCYCLTLANTKRKTEQAKTRWARFRDLLGIEEENTSIPPP